MHSGLKKTIPVSGPSITEKEISYVSEAAANAWYDNANCYNQRFEETFAAYIGVKHAISLPSCTSAIHLSLLALGIGPGDEVIVPDVTWIASAAPVSYVGAVPVFADIDPCSWCLSSQALERTITPRTRAIISVDLYGGMPEMPAIQSIADRHGLVLIEDAAEAFGSEQGGRRAGSFGNAGVFSFHGSKTMTTGEGGMLVTDDDAIEKRVQFLRDHGRPPGDFRFQNAEVAYKYKMSSLQAALGLAQVERAGELVRKKREIFNWYHTRLQDVDGISLNREIPDGLNSYWMVTVVTSDALSIDKFEIIDRMREAGVDCRPFFSPLSSLPAYREHPSSRDAEQRNPVSYDISKRGINLPSGLNITESDVDYITDVLLGVIGE